MTPKPSHISLQYLKTLAPKLLYCQHEPENHPPNTNQFRDQLWTRALTVFSPGDERLDLALRERILGSLTDFAIQESNSPFHIYLEAAKEIDCPSCANGRSVCKVSESGDESANYENLRNPGTCIQPLHRLFKVSKEVASYFYARYAPNARYDLHFHTEHSSKERLHDVPVPYHVDGRTGIETDHSVIVLTLNSQTFDLETYRAILYVLFHECICHAFQGNLGLETRERSGCSRNDFFCEGWMDFVAIEVLLDFLNGDFPDLKEQRNEVDRARHFTRVARHFHDERGNRDAQQPNPSAGAHYFGEFVASAVLQLLVELDLDHPREVFYHLSFGLNAAVTDEKERREFMNKLGAELEPFWEHPSSQLPRISHIFQAFSSHRDIERLRRDLQRFRP